MDKNKELKDMLSEIIQQEIRAALKDKNIETPYDGYVVVVEEADDNTNPYAQQVTVNVVGYDTMVTLRNLSGELLNEYDRVRIYATNGNLSNGYIGVKCSY